MEWQRHAEKKWSGNEYGDLGAPLETQAASRIKLEERKEEAFGPCQDPDKYTLNVTDNRKITEGTVLRYGGKIWLTEHKRLQLEGGRVGKKPGESLENVLPAPEVLEGHGTKPKRHSLDVEWEGIQQHNRQ